MSGISYPLSHPQLPQQLTMKTSRYSSSSLVFPSLAVQKIPRSSSNHIFKTFGFRGGSTRLVVQCTNNRSGGPGFGDSDSKSVLDAFFLGKALAVAINERIESTVGELFSTFGRLQAEQQKQVREFQEEVMERAKREKEKVARPSLEAQGLITKSTITTTLETTDASLVVSPSPATEVTPEKISPLSSYPSTDATSDDPGKNDPTVEISNDD